MRTGRRIYRMTRIAEFGTRIQCRIFIDAPYIFEIAPDLPALHMDVLQTAGFSLPERRGILPGDTRPFPRVPVILATASAANL
ncbi:hypothetical protein VH569_18570 [Azospirillum sp. 11R-A]